MESVLDKCLTPTCEMIMNIMEIENALINTNHPDLLAQLTACSICFKQTHHPWLKNHKLRLLLVVIRKRLKSKKCLHCSGRSLRICLMIFKLKGKRTTLSHLHKLKNKTVLMCLSIKKWRNQCSRMSLVMNHLIKRRKPPARGKWNKLLTRLSLLKRISVCQTTRMHQIAPTCHRLGSPMLILSLEQPKNNKSLQESWWKPE